MKVLIINPGATSTKVSVFEEKAEIWKQKIDHSAADLQPFARIIDQAAYRKDLILHALEQGGFRLTDFDAVCGRGGLLRHIPSGTYRISDRAIADVMDPPYGEHASNLGVLLARELGDLAGIPSFFVDPVSVDELSDVARVSGFRGMQRESFFHALNHKSTARHAAEQLDRPYEDLNLIVLHLGGGVSVAAHDHGRVIDNYNVKDEGAFGLDRGGSLPVNAVINLCFSGKTRQEVKKLLGTEAGAYSYVGTKDFLEIETRAFEHGDADCRMVFDALAYQLCKDVGAMAAVLKFQVDAIVYTGGMAYSDRLCQALTDRVGSLAPVIRLPGEAEMQALAEGALRVLHGEAAKEYR